MSLPVSTAKKILIVGPAWVGDMVMAQTLFIYLKQQLPEVQIDVIAPAWSQALLARMPEVRKGIVLPFAHGEFKPLARYRLGKSLRSEEYDWAIVLPYTWKSALVPFGANIKTRTGYVGEQRWGLLNDIRKMDKAGFPLMVQRYLHPVQQAGDPAKTDYRYPRLRLNSENQERLIQIFSLAKDRPAVAFCPGAEYGPAKRWPLEYFIKVGNKLIDEGRQIWLMGGEKDRELTRIIQQALPDHCIDLAGKTKLEDAIDLIGKCESVLTNDSGLMHIAAAVETKIYAIYGSSTPVYTPPLADNAEILSIHADCSPCFKRECPYGHYKCLKELTADVVLEAMRSQHE